jgi:uncharacterized protein (DUF885 family)
MKKMRKFLFILVLFVFTLLTTSCKKIVENIDPGDFDEYTEKLFGTLIGNDEMTIHFLFKNRDKLPIEKTNLSLPTPGSNSALGVAIINLYFGPIKNYDYNTLSFDQKMTYNVIVDLLDSINEKTGDMVYLDNNYLGSYLGYQAQLPILFAEYRFDNVQDVENYFGLMKLVPETFKEYVNYEFDKADAGYGMPDFVIDKVIDQCIEFISSGDDHFLISTFPERLEVLNLTDKQKEKYIEENKDIVKSYLNEGYAYVRDSLPKLKGSSTNEMGLAHYKKINDDGKVTEIGKEYYAYLFKDATGYEDSIPDAINYIQSHLDEIIRNIVTISQNNPNIGDIVDSVVLMDNSPEEQMELYKKMIVGHFPQIEKYPEINIKNVHPSMEDHFSPAAYISSPIDDFDQESIFLNQLRIDGDYNYLYTTLAHEGIPGHMYQNIYFKSQDTNIIRKVLKNSGYMEGWATYSELYMYNFVEGLSDDVIQYMKNYDILNGVLTARLDMGIHYEGWTLEETCEFLSKYFKGYTLETTRPIYEQLVEVPTNSQTYYYTYFKLCDMYERAENALGSKFSALDFHKLILDCGPVPLRFVETVVDEYIKANK